jgi:spermidine synthase
MLPYALAIFSGAFLLFQVQPLIGKYILPWFGGGPGVWTTCLLFFQVLLLGGYAYAHFSATRLKPRTQGLLHGALLLVAMIALPIAPGGFWKAHVAGSPTLHILLLLGGTIGLPYFVLSATGPLLQQWFSARHPGVSPYRLYALSNIGSLLALLSYPVFFEVKFTRLVQANLWSAGFVVFAALCGYCAWLSWRQAAAPMSPVAATADPDAADPLVAALEAPSATDKLLWVTLPAIASVLLLATTNKLCQDVAVIPFLWVLPLSLYLLSFVICFDHARWYNRPVFGALLAIGLVVVFQLLASGNGAPLWLQVTGYTGALFVACMFCHGELYQLKPLPRHLTGYYLAISAGGALGGILVALVAPAIFSDYRELPIGLWLLSYFAGIVCFRHRSWALAYGTAVGLMLAMFVLPVMRAHIDDRVEVGTEFLEFFSYRAWAILVGLVLFLAAAVSVRSRGLLREWRPRLGGFMMALSVAVGVTVIVQWQDRDTGMLVDSSRNFYGTLKVFEHNIGDPAEHYYLLLHGATTHGLQLTADDKAMLHTTYYGENSGVGLAIEHLPRPAGQRRIGLVGLGTGTLASYGTPGDYLRIYEINPAVKRLAESRFTYLRRCPAKVDVIMGDARLSMEREVAAQDAQKFDLLALDAFSSDAIPVHLLTKEAFALYWRELKSDGILAVHTSNRYLELRPVVERLAAESGLTAVTISDDLEPTWWIYRTTWILVTKNESFLEQPAISEVAEWAQAAKGPLWTDDHASLYEILRRPKK